MQAYEQYKDSGIEWLGEIPAHWEVRKIKHSFRLSKGLTITKENLQDEGIRCVNYGEIHSKYGFEVNPEIHQLKSVSYDYLKFSRNSLIQKGDFVFADTSEDIEGSGNFTCLWGDEKIFAGYHTVIAKPKNDINSRFISYEFDAISFRNQIRAIVKGVKVFSITQAILKELTFYLPPLPEQEAIAAFLDDKCGKIDDAVRIKEQQIEKLKELRQITIHHAVTQGINPEVEMKDSGIEWIGEIPKHWEVKRLKNILKTKLQYGANESGVEYATGLPRYIRISDFGLDGKLNEEKKISLPPDKAKHYQLKDGDILFARSGATVGKAYKFNKTQGDNTIYCFAGYLIRAEVDPDIVISSYLYSYTQSGAFSSWKDTIFNKATIENIGADKYAELAIPISPVLEQQKIVTYLEEKTSKIDKAITLKTEQIAKLKEYKQSLINEVVTGKVMVNG